MNTTPDVVDGESRGMPNPGSRVGDGRGRGVTMLGVALLTGATLFLLWQNTRVEAQPVEEERSSGRDLRSTLPSTRFELPPEPEPEPELVAEPEAEPTPAAATPIPVVPTYQLPAVESASEEAAPATLYRTGGLLSDPRAGGGGQGTSGARAVEYEGELESGILDEGGTDGPIAQVSDFESTLRPTQLEGARAGRLPDRNLLITRGTVIDCALQTRLVSALPGGTSCMVSRNVYSANGRVLLIERGSRLTGEYRSAVVNGLNRIGVLWTRVETPTGVIVALDSPATGPLGATGIPGALNTHFWRRFGGAILLSFVDDLGSAVTAATTAAAVDASSNLQAEIEIGVGSGSAGSRAINDILSQTINIPPTVEVNQGARVGVYVARDLDFRGVYDVRAR